VHDPRSDATVRAGDEKARLCHGLRLLPRKPASAEGEELLRD
jgi:hypothetical protein